MTPEPVHVWYWLTEQLSEGAVAQAREVLSPAENQRCDRFRFARDRRDYAAAHALLRSALSTLSTLSTLSGRDGVPPSAWVFEAGHGGKPFLAPGQSALEFNLAHTAGLVACALTNAGPVGVDAESHVRAIDAEELADRYFSGREVVALRELNGAELQKRFIDLWTLKEAYLKAVGVGLSHPLGDFGFDLQGPSGLRFDPPPGTVRADWQFALLVPSEHHRMAVAVQHDRRVELKVREWPSGADMHSTIVRVSAPENSDE